MKKIYTILENIYSENTVNVFNYDDEKLAMKNFDDLYNYYKDNYSNYFNNSDYTYISDNYLCINDIVCVELFENDINQNIIQSNTFTYLK
jgi:hypothetical protein